jgi:spermidine/putrescine transport system substrate-binding protein
MIVSRQYFTVISFVISSMFPISVFSTEKVIVYNWSEYIPSGVFEAFQKETGIQVEYHTFDTNEEMYEQIKAENGLPYDVIVPSTYLVSKMQRESLLRPLDKSKLKNFRHLDPTFLNKPYDVGNKFSLPYLWGSTGIGINTDKIDPASITSWQDLWDPKWKGRLLLTDDIREVFHMAFVSRQYSTNTTEPYRIKAAFKLLQKLMPNEPMFEAEVPRQPFLDGKVDIGMIWSGEVIMAQQENPAIRYIYPREGAAFWIDNFAIPSKSENVDNAHAFIDFMLKPDVARRAVEELGFATPNLTARNLLDDDIRSNPVIFPPAEEVVQGEFQQELGEEADKLLDAFWQKLKGARNGH